MPSINPSLVPSINPTVGESDSPSSIPTSIPSYEPTTSASDYPSEIPSNIPSLYPSELPSMSPSVATFPPIPCIPSNDDFFFENSTLIENNLGGKGPWNNPSNATRFQGVARINNQIIDLKITVKDNSSYVQVKGNGYSCPDSNCTSGNFGAINLKLNEVSTLLFSFVNSANDLINIPAFYFSLYDIDHGKKTGEEFGVTGFTAVSYDVLERETHFYNNTSDFCKLQSPEKGNCFYAKSKEIGKGCDNPINPIDLGPFDCDDNQGRSDLRTFQLYFEERSQFEVYFKTTCSKSNCTAGRNMLFAFRSGLVNNCTEAMVQQ